MLAGISTACFYPQHTERALASLASHGVQATEIFVNCGAELEEPYLKQLRRTADGAGMKILSIHPYTSGFEPMLFFSRYNRRFDEGREFYKRYYNAANVLGAEIVVFHGNTRHVEIPNAMYFELFERLMRDALRFGVKLCQENVVRCASRTSAFFSEMAAALPDARFVFDVKQALRSGEDVYSFARAMGNRIAHLHISDHDGENECLVPGKGVLNIPELLSIVSSNGFSGGVIVELYRDNFHNVVEILQGYQLLCGILSTYR